MMRARSMLQRLLSPYRVRSQPLMTRQSYSRELITSLMMPMAYALIEGRVVAVLAARVFQINNFEFATIMAAPAVANLSSIAWAHLARGRPKVRFMTRLQTLVLLLIAAVGLLPATHAGGVTLVVMVTAMRCLMAGLVTIRSTIWRHNYPRAVRGQVTSRLAILSTVIMSVAPLIAAPLLDYNAMLFRWVYPLSALVASAGVIAFSRVRVRREGELLTYERQAAAKPTAHGEPGSVYEYDEKAPAESNTRFWHVLRQDRYYRDYQLWQFIGGMANLMGDAAVARLVVSWTSDERYPVLMQQQFLISVLLLVTIPSVVMILLLPKWAAYFDGVHIAEFRARHSKVWIVLQGLNFISALTAVMVSPMLGLCVLVLAQAAVGVANAGGMLAWNLGHNDFADRKMVAVYMGIHIMLTGVRGLFAAYLGIYIMEGFSGWGVLPQLPGVGPYVFIVTLAMAIVCEAGYRNLKNHFDRGDIKKVVQD